MPVPPTSTLAMLICSLSPANPWFCPVQPVADQPVPPAPPPIFAPPVPGAPLADPQPPLPVPPLADPQLPAPQLPAPQLPAPQLPAPQPPPPAAGPTAELPAQVLDLDNWYLTLPTGQRGSPDTVEQPRLADYRSSWFRVTDAGDGVAFTANAGGVTTKNSSYPRSELREMNGAQKASWSNASGTHTLTVRQAVTALPTAKPEIVTAQIHDSEDDVLQVRLEGPRLTVQYDDGRSETTIDPDYRLGTVFEVKIVAADRRVLVFYNGERKAEIPRSGAGWYFKSGSYLQSNTSKGDRSGATGTVVIYGLRVTHSG